MRGGGGDQEGQSGSHQGSRDSSAARRASSSIPSPREEEEENDNNSEESNTGVASTHKGNNSPRETIVLDASYPPPTEDFQDEDEDDDDALEVVVETLFGDIFRVRVSQWDTAAGLKNLLFRTQGIPMSQQHLLLGQAELVDDACLIDQGVVDGSTLRLVVAMRGGPINARRLPTHQDLLRDISDYVDTELEGEKLWDGNGGRTVTLLVLRDGDNVNIYRVVENGDGTFSPLNESFSSMASSDQLERETMQAVEDGAKTRARMKELQARMDAVKLKKKAKKDKSKVYQSQRSISRASRGTIDRPEETTTTSVPAEGVSESPGKPSGEPGSRPASHHRYSKSGKRTSLLSHRAGRASRPTTQERSDVRRNSLSLSKSSSTMKGLPLKEIHSKVQPVNIDFTRKKPLEDIQPKQERNRLSAVDEELVRSRSNYQPPNGFGRVIKPKKTFESYRKSLVRHGKVSDTGGATADFDDDDTEDDSYDVWPKREATVPLYMPPVGPIPRRGYEGDRLNRSHNQDLLRVARANTSIRPKTSPEVLEHRPGSTGGQSTISERIHLRAPDERLREICTILSNSRTNSRQSHHSLDSPPDTIYPPSLSTSFSGSTGLMRRTNSVSVSLSSLKSYGGSPPSPGHGALVASGSREQRDKVREYMRSQATASRRSTPESLRHQGRRPGSGRLHATPPHLPPVSTPKRKKKHKTRCSQCAKGITIVNKYDCRCGRIFCTRHRYPETHDCTFDFKTEGRKIIEMANPLIAIDKLPKI